MKKPLWKTVSQLRKNLELPYGQENSLLCIYPRELKTYVYKSLYTNIHRSNIHNSAKVKTTQCPWTDEWKNKTRCIYTMEHYLAIERNEVLIHKDKPSKYNAK